MADFLEKCLKTGKCCVVCGLVVAVSAVWHGKAEAGESGKGRYCLIVPPERYKPAVEPVRHVAGADEISDFSGAGRVVTFFKGQMKKVGFGTPDCFRIEPEEAAALAVREQGSASFDLSNLHSEPANLFPGAGYFNRVSRDGRRGMAFGAGIGQTPVAPHEEYGTPDAKVGIVFGFNF